MKILDQLNRPVVLEEPPRRIVSLVPSQTELLYDLGLDEEVLGITKFCVHPSHWLKSKTVVGGTKQHHFDKIAALKPALIIANKEENTKENIEQLSADYPVYVSDVSDLKSALAMIGDLGRLCARKEKGIALCSAIEEKINNYLPPPNQKYRVLYLIWQEPFMAAGSDTFISAMLKAAGYENAISEKRYPKLSREEITQIKPDHIFFSSEPFPFAAKHLATFKNEFGADQLHLVDGEMFSWYGSRLLKAVDYWSELVIK